MISKRAGIKELEIFENFQIDKNLPKYNDKNKILFENNDSMGNTLGGMGWVDIPVNGGHTGILVNGKPFHPTLKAKLIGWLLKKLYKTNSTQEENIKKKRKLITIIDFFTSLSESYKELTPIADIAEHYQNALIQAKTMGQQALYEKLEDLLEMVRGEAHLITMGLKKYVNEKQVCDFYEKVGEDKNLKLTWIKNFNRIIPEEIYKSKKDVDDRKIFDNYVILHYDPENNGEKLTKKEIEKKKDPILFGVIKNSRKLYYIGDWKDEYCELTLEEMFTVLKGKVLQINNRSVKTFISKTKV